MSTDDIPNVIVHEMRRIAPDVEISDINPDGDLREEFDIDSMDFLNLVTALGKRFSIPVPESDYARMASYSALCEYLREVTS